MSFSRLRLRCLDWIGFRAAVCSHLFFMGFYFCLLGCFQFCYASARESFRWPLQELKSNGYFFLFAMNTTPVSGTMDFRPSANVDGEAMFTRREIWSSL